MKKILLALAFVLCAGAARAETYTASVSSYAITNAVYLSTAINGPIIVDKLIAQVEETSVNTILSVYDNCTSTNAATLITPVVIQASSGSNVGGGSNGIVVWDFQSMINPFKLTNPCFRKPDAASTVRVTLWYR